MFIISHLLNELSNVFSLLFFGKTSDAADLVLTCQSAGGPSEKPCNPSTLPFTFPHVPRYNSHQSHYSLKSSCECYLMKTKQSWCSIWLSDPCSCPFLDKLQLKGMVKTLSNI